MHKIYQTDTITKLSLNTKHIDVDNGCYIDLNTPNIMKDIEDWPRILKHKFRTDLKTTVLRS